MIYIPVDKYLQILSTILVEKRNINALTHITGYSYKPSFTNKLKILENERLVKRTMDEKHKQKQNIELTELGKEIIIFYEDLKKVKRSYHTLNKKFLEYTELANKTDTLRKNILKTKNWSQQDIDNFTDFRAGVHILKSEIVRNITNIIVNRYVAIFLEFEVKDIGRLIIKRIFEEFIDFMNNDLIEFKNDPALSQKKQNIEEFKSTIIKSTIGNMYYRFPDIIYDEVKKLSIAYINLVNPSKNTIKILSEEENITNDGDRAFKKSKNHFDVGELFKELAKKGPPQSAISWLILSDVARNHKFNLEPDSKLIKDVYRNLLD